MGEEGDSLAEEIIADARRRAERARQRAEREAEEVLDEARQRAEAARGRVLSEAGRRAERQQRRIRARIDQEVDALRRNVRHQVLERVRAEAEKELAGLSRSDGHRDVMVGLAVDAIGAMSGERFQLVLRAEDRRRWGTDLLESIRRQAEERLGRRIELEMSDETVNALGGLKVVGAGGHEVADQTFGARLERLWDQISGRAAEWLPDPEEAGG